MTVGSLTATPDPNLDRVARLATELLDVPVALVGLEERDRLVLPGAAGLPAGLDARRSAPLARSLCRCVVEDAGPLVIDDARGDARLPEPAAAEVAVGAYAGFPVTDADGHVVGALCAIDHQPRNWTADELGRLEDLAQLCSREIVLHEITQRAAAAEPEPQSSATRAGVLLELSEVLADTLTMLDVGAAVVRAATLGVGARHAGIWFRPDRNEHSLRGALAPTSSWRWAQRWARIPLDSDHVVASVYRTGAGVFLPEGCDVDDHCAGAAVVLPLFSSGAVIGALMLTWADPHPFSDDERATLAALAVYAARAVQRASLLDERMGAASTMQRALLTPLPAPPGLDLGARYRTAAANDQVGGDWYDATVLGDGSVTLMIGDVIGHDIRAAAAMGQLRSMLRAFSWALDDAPSVNVTRLDCAARDLQVSTLASLLYARLDRPDPRTGRRRMRWTNAGHLPPVVVSSLGRSRVLGDAGPADTILGVRPDAVRRDQQVDLDPGDTVLFFTDGLIERRGESIDDGLQRLRDALERYHARPVEELLDSVLGEVAGTTHADDLALLAVHLPLLATPPTDGLNRAFGGKADPREHVAALAVR